MKTIKNMWAWIIVLAVVTFTIFGVFFEHRTAPAPVAPPPVSHAMCSRVVMLTQCTKVEKVYRHTAAPHIISGTCVQIDDNIFCGQLAIERLTEEQCKQYKDTTWSIQN